MTVGGGESTTLVSSRLQALRSMDELSGNLAELAKHHSNLEESSRKVQEMYSALVRKIGELAAIAARSRTTDPPLLMSIKQLQEMSQSFNTQYLMLQEKISHENRQYSMLSNIMKSKHDTAKNSINNIR